MNAYRGENRGRSVHNQRIERLWNDSIWIRRMEEEIVNPNDYGIDWDGPISKSNDDVS
ncbi:hypothetical protein RhiirA4_536674 [Rhizophagus irregularis]|uniref:Uncharacterized protein n=1 Tax=Rhizophagus irregularis TaxID=588596 RepID=A0A2I1FTL0_9GLOM|nr:hypothetical protein RhiirA4_536674 [Rhizophagus irregularis]